MSARNSWVSARISLPDRSRERSSQRAQPGFHGVRGIARRGLLGLREQDLLMAKQCCAQRRALLGNLSEAANVQGFAGAGKLYDCLVQRNLPVQGGGGTEHAVAADHGSFDALATRPLDHQRDDPAVRVVDAVDGVARLIQNSLVLQFGGLEVRSQQLDVRRDQRKRLGNLAMVLLPFRREQDARG
jgi:hypothetical protein